MRASRHIPGPRARAAVIVCVLVALIAPARTQPRAALSDAEFWSLVGDLSEPGGFFRSDNLVSNEGTFQRVIPDLVASARRGRAYLGVGPEQNFTYIAAVDPSIAFITDIRRGNLQLQLLYKALFELSETRAEFAGRLFSRAVPPLPADASASELLDAVAAAPPRRDLFDRTLAAVLAHLRGRHGFRLDPRDDEGLRYVLNAFYWGGPGIAYSNTPSAPGTYPSFAEMQMATDAEGVAHGYLASDTLFERVRSLETRNLIVPLVGDFAGPKTIRSIGAYLRARSTAVGAFYTSNVEQYLFEDGTWRLFAENVAQLPIDASSVFIRSCFNANCGTGRGARSSVLLDPIDALMKDVSAGLITSYADVLAFRRQP